MVRRGRVEHFILPTVPVLAYDRQAPDWRARERGRSSQIARMPLFADGWVVAIADAHGLVLVTSDARHSAHLSEPRIESWG